MENSPIVGKIGWNYGCIGHGGPVRIADRAHIVNGHIRAIYAVPDPRALRVRPIALDLDRDVKVGSSGNVRHPPHMRRDGAAGVVGRFLKRGIDELIIRARNLPALLIGCAVPSRRPGIARR